MSSEAIVMTPRQPNREMALVREANHRIANNLAQLAGLVQFQLRGLQKNSAGTQRLDTHALLREVMSKIVSLGELHRRLAECPEEEQIELGDFLIQSCTSILSLLSLKDHVSVAYRLDTKCHVPAPVAHSFGLILGEVVMNAVKHAHPTGLPIIMRVACSHSDAGLVVVLEDDGVGLPVGFNVETDGGTGFQIIRALAKNAGAQLDIESDSLGLSVRLILPDSQRKN